MPKKHPCPDCRHCLWCTDTRCSVCLRKSKPCQRKLSQGEQIALYESINRTHHQRNTEVRMKQRALFLCTDGSCLSPMAAALVNLDFGDRLQTFCAAVTLSSLDPHAAAVTAELGIDIARLAPAPLNHYEREPFDYVITLSDQATDRCPLYFGGVKRQPMSFSDPSLTKGSEEQILAAFRATRDILRQQLGDFFRQQLAQQ
jgi:arsenate reductase